MRLGNCNWINNEKIPFACDKLLYPTQHAHINVSMHLTIPALSDTVKTEHVLTHFREWFIVAVRFNVDVANHLKHATAVENRGEHSIKCRGEDPRGATTALGRSDTRHRGEESRYPLGRDGRKARAHGTPAASLHGTTIDEKAERSHLIYLRLVFSMFRII